MCRLCEYFTDTDDLIVTGCFVLRDFRQAITSIADDVIIHCGSQYNHIITEESPHMSKPLVNAAEGFED